MKRVSIAALFILLVANLATHADAAEGCGAGLLEGKRITVEVEGDGPDVVLIPGLSSSPHVWDGLTETSVPGARSTPAPASTTCPEASCPEMIGSRTRTGPKPRW